MQPLIKVEWYFESPLKLRPARDVSHYTDEFIESIFKRHHFAAIISVFAAFLFLLIIGFFLDNAFFQLPAGCQHHYFLFHSYWCGRRPLLIFCKAGVFLT